ncbi:hypothetical protein [Litoribacter populi]|uniref:hypothetical protein n=1 Tax=Litoribacter populi TaxID=2598460 RepID=UPI00117E01EC|nr:hypothetical protein [Litoribacter populi]
MNHYIHFRKLHLGWVLLLMALLVTPIVEAQTVITSKGTNHHIIEEKSQSLKVEYEGEISLGPDDRYITSISDGGYIRIEKTTFGNKRELFISSRGNELDYEYKEGGRKKPFDPTGKAWLADLLPELLQSTTIAAEARVDRIYSSGGAKGVVNELRNLKSDHVKAKYATLLMGKNLRDSEVPMVIDAIGENIRSDHFRAEIFKQHHQMLLSNPRNQGAFLKAVETIGSDHYKTELVKLLVKNHSTSGQQQQLLQLIGTIQSDHYRAEILNQVPNDFSDREMDFLLGQLVPEIKSDHYKSEVLGRIMKRGDKLNSKNIDAMIHATGGINSDHYRNNTLKDLVKSQSLSAQNYETLFSTLGRYNSDHYKSEFMQLMVKEGKHLQNYGQFIQEASKVKSDFHRSEILLSLLGKVKLSEEQLLTLISSVSNMSSDHFKAEVLKKSCQANGEQKVKAAIREAAKSIKSTHFSNEVLRCAS